MAAKNVNFHTKLCDSFIIFAENKDCGYTIELVYQLGSSEYPQPMFTSRDTEKMHTL